MSFILPGTLRHGEFVTVETTIGGGSEGAEPIAHGLVWEFGSDGRPLTVSDTAGAALTMEYSTLLDTVVDPAGRRFELVYDASERLTAVRCTADAIGSYSEGLKP